MENGRMSFESSIFSSDRLVLTDRGSWDAANVMNMDISEDLPFDLIQDESLAINSDYTNIASQNIINTDNSYQNQHIAPMPGEVPVQIDQDLWEFLENVISSERNSVDDLTIYNTSHPHGNFSITNSVSDDVTRENMDTSSDMGDLSVSSSSSVWKPSYHQQASYLQVLDRRLPTGHELYRTPVPVVSLESLMVYPNESTKAFNMGNTDRLKLLVSSYFNDNCLLRVIKPHHTEERVGSSYLLILFNALLESHPDAVNTIRSIKYCKSKSGARLLKVKYTFSGTQVTSAPLVEFKGKTFVPHEDSIVNDMDVSQLSQVEVESFRRREEALKQEGKLINIESDIVLKMYIDGFTNKVGIYEAHCKASSFKAIN